MAGHSTTERRATILVAHGSRNPNAQEAHEALVERVGKAGGLATSAAYLEMAEPSIPDAIEQAVAGGATEVVLVPCFLHPGNHVLVDLPAIVEEARGRHRDVRLSLAEHLGASEALVPLVLGLAGTADPGGSSDANT